ncbi:SLK, partial [Cordylochernes scorpioides]
MIQELEHVKRFHARKEEELLKWQTIEKRQLPKRIRAEMKTRELMFKESLRISLASGTSFEEDKDKLKKFQEAEKKRYKAEQQRQESKQKKQLEELRATAAAALKDLESLQNTKRQMLGEYEKLKVQQLDADHAKEIEDWKNDVKPRKQ